MEAWEKTWREGFSPGISTEGLVALHDALLGNKLELIQGATTLPMPAECAQDCPVECACAAAYTGWRGDELDTVGEVEAYFGRLCFFCDSLLGESGGCRHFLNWFDDTKRSEVIRKFVPVLNDLISQRKESNDARDTQGLQGNI